MRYIYFLLYNVKVFHLDLFKTGSKNEAILFARWNSQKTILLHSWKSGLLMPVLQSPISAKSLVSNFCLSWTPDWNIFLIMS